MDFSTEVGAGTAEKLAQWTKASEHTSGGLSGKESPGQGGHWCLSATAGCGGGR